MSRLAILVITAMSFIQSAYVFGQEPVKLKTIVNPSFPAGILDDAYVLEEAFLLPNGRVGLATLIRGDRRYQQVIEQALSEWIFEPAHDKPLRRVLLGFTFYATTNTGLKKVVKIELIPEKGLYIRLGPPIVVPLAKSIGTEFPQICRIHDEKLLRDIVGIGYGLVLADPAFDKARAKLFPHSRFYVSGGCVVQAEDAAEVLYCPKCREAETNWLRVHRKERM